jgi:glycosyltransferase involved in cell wall biosynthesis
MNEREPEVSVVMSVYNGAAQLPATLDSVLAQSEPDFELVIVDDGSRDEAPEILARYAARDPRIRIISQDNQGLTRALIRGCAEARGRFIARQDNGDLSLPNRLERSLAAFRERPERVLVGCETQFVGPEGEPLLATTLAPMDIQTKLRTARSGEFAGLTHGSAMFPAEAYRRAGGYRPQFYFAQDVDLWIRLASLGEVWIIPEILCEMVIAENTVSGRYRKQQLELLDIALALRDSSPSPEQQAALLDRASRLRPSGKKPPSGAERARALYFIAACLRRRGDRRALVYARRALRANPLHLRSWFLLLRGVKP